MVLETLVNMVKDELEIQINKRKTLLTCMDQISLFVDNQSDTNNVYTCLTLLDNIRNSFVKINYNIDSLKKQEKLLKNNNTDEFWNYRGTCENSIKNNNIEIETFLQDYLNYSCLNIAKSAEKDIKKEIKNTESSIEKTINLPHPENISKKVQEEPYKNTEKSVNISEPLVDNKTLLISEMKNKVFLPYKIDELENILEKDHGIYANLNDVIDSKYILPLSRFKYPVISRFKEAFSLMRNKENASLTESLDIAIELSMNNLLNPAVIAACKNLNELDIYLDCLNSNELDKFNIFDVQYEIPPVVQ